MESGEKSVKKGLERNNRAFVNMENFHKITIIFCFLCKNTLEYQVAKKIMERQNTRG